MAVNIIFVLVLLCVCAITDGHLIIYNTNSDHKPSGQDFDPENAGLLTQMRDVESRLENISSNINALTKRMGSLESAVETTRSCPDGWFSSHQGSCYMIGEQDVNFTTAETLCGQQQAHLVHLETKFENMFLQNFLTTYFKGGGSFYWIGMTDSETEGVWKMTGTDTLVPFTDWASGEPQNVDTFDPTGEDCAAFYNPKSFKWADVNCSTKTARVVCERVKK